jgi:iron complex outermembrane receptor protein
MQKVGEMAMGFRKFAAPMRVALLGGSAVACLAMPGMALAQTAEEEDETNMIVVTARLQNETLQEVPVTVAVVDSKSIEDYHLTKIEDIAARVPTLNVQVGGSGSGGSIALRGIGTSSISAAFDSAIGFDYDGVTVSSMRLLQAGFFDVGQIEVLKGPQSLYFGKSATAGVLSLKSAEPTKTWQVGGKASYEFEEKGKVVSGFISGPLSDTLGVRVAAQYSDASRFQRFQAGTPTALKAGGLKDFVGRVTLNWNPQDRFTANLKVQFTRNENDGAISQSDLNCGPNGVADVISLFGSPATAGVGVIHIAPGYDCNDNDGRYYVPDSNPAIAGSVPLPSRAAGFDGVAFGKTDVWFSRLRMDLDMSDSLKLTSISGFLNMDAIDVGAYSYGGVGPIFSPFSTIPGPTFGLPVGAIFPGAYLANNAPGTPSGVGTSDPTNKLLQYSQELRLASDFDGPFNFMVGAFYESRKYTFDTSQQAVNISLITPDPTLPLLAGGVAPGTGYTFDWDKIHITKTDAYSLFGSVSFKPTEQIEISGGLRYTDEKKVNTIRIPYVHNLLAYVPDPLGSGLFVPSPAFLQSGFFSGPIRFSDNNFSPEATIKYQINPDFNVFASYKTGFKSGGIDNSALPSNSLSQAAVSGDFSSLIFDSEKARGGEIGFKSQLAGRTLTLNGTAYYYTYKDLQVQLFNATTIQFITLNAGKVTTKGAELEMRWRTPLEGLSFSTNISYLKGQVDNDFFTPGPNGIDESTPAGPNGKPPNTLGGDDINLKGRAVGRAPKWSGNVAFDYTAPIGDSLSLQLGGNMVFSGSYFTTVATPTDYVQKSYQTFDGRVSFGDIDDKWRIALVGVNLTDKIVTQTSGGRPFLQGPNPLGVREGDDIILQQNRGRQIFVEASFKF